MLTPGQNVRLTIEKPVAGGRMIARVGGQVVLVAGAIPGEEVAAVVGRVAKGVVYADTVAVEQPSPDRRESPDPLCGGCLYAYIAYPRQLELKAAVIEDAFRRIARVALPARVSVVASPEEGYRMRARLHVRGRRIGFFREGTHDLCDPGRTRQLLPATLDVLNRLAAGFQAMAIDSIREIELAENIDASNRVVQLDAVSAISPLQLEGLATEGLTGLVSQGETAGSPYATDRLALGDGIEVTLRRHVRAFFQGNRYLLSALVHHVIGCVPEKSTVVDLYAGAGLFSLSAAALRGATVVAVEGDRIAAADLHANASTSGGAVTPVHQTVEAFLETSVQADCLVVDPPRTGVSRQALDAIVGRRAARIVYISCDVATLARDARRLIDAGYTLERIDGFDLFPNTPHVETVAVFQNLKDVTI